MHVRRAVPEDGPAMAEVHIRSWQAGYRGQLPDEFLDGLGATLERRVAGWTRQTVDARLDVFVAETDGRVVGFTSSGPSRDADLPDHGELETIYVLGAAWGAGVGSALMDAALGALADRGYPAALLWVLEGNDRTLRFYDRHGWARDGAEKTEPWGPVDLDLVRLVRPI